MVPADGQADLPVDLEAATGGQEAEGRRAQGVRGREDDAAVVDAMCIGGGRGALEREVPFKKVGFQGGGMQGRVRVGLKLAGFFEDALDGRGFGVEGWERHCGFFLAFFLGVEHQRGGYMGRRKRIWSLS